MHKKLLAIVLFTSFFTYSQNATQVYLFDLIQNDSVFTIENPINISKSEGYNNQPSFLHDGTGVLFASTRYNQTDVVLYNLENQTKGLVNQYYWQ